MFGVATDLAALLLVAYRAVQQLPKALQIVWYFRLVRAGIDDGPRYDVSNAKAFSAIHSSSIGATDMIKPMKARLHLALMISAALIPIAVGCAAALQTLLNSERSAAQRSMTETARAASLGVDRTLSNAETTLRVLAQSGLLRRDALRALHARASAVGVADQFWIVLLDSDGQQLLNSSVPFGTTLPKEDDARGLREIAKANIAIVTPLTFGRVTHKMVTAVVLPTHLNDGTSVVLAASMTPDHFSNAFTPLQSSQSWLLGLFDQNGRTIKLSRQLTSGLIGAFPKPDLRNAILAQRRDIFRNRSRDGAELYTTLVRSPYSGWTIAVGVPVGEIERAARRAVALTAFGLTFALLISALFATLFGRHLIGSIGGAKKAADSIANGTSPARFASPIAEFNELSAVLTDAGQLLANESQSRVRAESELASLLEREQRARQDAEQANDAKDQFLAMLGHEIRNPLAGIAGAVGLLKNPRATDRHNDMAIGILDRQSKALTHIVDDLLDVARVTSGKIVLALKPIDVAEAVAHCVASFQAAGRFDNHRMTVNNISAIVNGDLTRLEQVISNLLGNALKFTPDGGSIALIVSCDANSVTITITDSGIGIAPTLLPTIFDIFVQGEITLDRSKGGLGIGLSLSRALVELHGGTISVASAGVGLGSRFIVSLPLLRERTQ